MRGKRRHSTLFHDSIRIIPAHAGQTGERCRFARFQPDHPRACGANDGLHAIHAEPVGSSPRMRGKQQRGGDIGRARRIIPAHAGQTESNQHAHDAVTDHPRACGANPGLEGPRAWYYGSSPRMRGKRAETVTVRGVSRIIPAHAGQTQSRQSQRPEHADHPRACGANRNTRIPTASAAGSSPRMRGKLGDPGGGVAGVRIIPAHAGQTSPATRPAGRAPDHPRACGANTLRRWVMPSRSGSSPRMRGKQRTGHRVQAARRIIPAHAGQTKPAWHRSLMPSDHPRACGANSGQPQTGGDDFGSSPRMRGKPAARSRRVMRVRIIPAHAGQTSAAARAGWSRPDHPRACGANVLTLHLHHAASGSSPRMRGKRLDFKGFELKSRIIPAHAGQTTTTGACDAATKDHPRACGANAKWLRSCPAPSGSSPRMRGKLADETAVVTASRIIPAHAGQTNTSVFSLACATDHPRACGANVISGRLRHASGGSSPRMRGKLHQVQRATYADRIIPGHAGQTPPDSPPVVFHPDHPRACGANAAVRRSFMIPSGSSPRMRGKHRIIVGAKMEPRIIPAHAGQTIVPRHPRTMCPDHPRACGANLESNASSCCATGSSPRMRGKRRR